jgi:prepilin-type N-terminal cleavage/methylation domain-containing protein
VNRRGFSIIELITVIAVIGLLSSFAILNFNSWQRKATVERYVKELYTDLQDARMRAAYTKVRQRVVVSANQVVFRRMSSTADPGTVLFTKPVPVTLVGVGLTGASSDQIDFDTRGQVNDPITKIICVTTNENAAYDALIVSPVITNMGKVINKGNVCGQTNVTQK